MFLPTRFSDIDQKIEQLVEGGLLKEKQPTLNKWLQLKAESKKQGHLHGYLNASCQLLSHYNQFFLFSEQKAEAIEILMVLENEDLARRIQGEMSLHLYQQQRQLNAPFAYQMLLDAEGEINGFHSAEMYQLISEGQQICRHLGCTPAMKEFSSFYIDYYLAAGELDEAFSIASRQYYAADEQVIDTWTDCFIGRKLSQIMVLMGNPVSASKIAEDCYNRLPENPLHPAGRLSFLSQWLVCRWLLDDGKETFLADTEKLIDPEAFPFAQYSMDHLNWDLLESWILAIGDRLSEALDILKKWDGILFASAPNTSWLEVRIRRIALLLAMKKLDEAKSLTSQAKSFAVQCDDQHALRRLNFLWENEESFNPLAIPHRYHFHRSKSNVPNENRFASPSGTVFVGIQEKNIARFPNNESDSEQNDNRLEELEKELIKLREAGPPAEDATESEIKTAEDSKTRWLAKLFSISTDISWSSTQVCRLLNLSLQVHAEYQPSKLWKWVKENTKLWKNDSSVLSVSANLGAHLIADLAPDDHQWLSHQQIQRMFQHSIDLDPDNAGNLWRAGEYRFFRDDMQPSRKFLRKAFDLDPTEPRFALSLAIANDHWEYVGEALEILDYSIRSGQKDSSVFMAAVEKCVEFGLWNQIQSYLTRYFQVEKDPSLWAVYYGAMSCFELQQWDLCQFYLLKTIQQDLPLTWHVQAIQTSLLAKQARSNDTEKMDRFRKAMEDLLEFPVYETPVVTSNIAEEGWDRLWRSVYPALLSFPELEKTFIDRLLAAGCLPPEYFEERRKSSAPKEKMSVYRIVFQQQLDETWETEPTRRFDQKDLEKYYAEWLVAAKDQQWAIDQATMWQSRCHSGPLELIDIQSEAGYFQWEGVIFQGQRGVDYEPEPEE